MRKVILILPALLVACGQPAPDNAAPPVLVETPVSTAAPDNGSLAEPPVAPDTAEAAAQVVQRYYALIEGGRHAEAYRMWEPGAAGLSEADFVRSFGRYAEYHAEIGAPGRIDSGAGQRYVEMPVRAYGTLKAGGPFNMQGTLTLHRVADIPGSTAEQRGWRIRDSSIRPRPLTQATPAP